MTDWPQRFHDLATLIATWSKDPSTKVGAVIIDADRRIVSTGYNGFPRGVYDYVDRYEDKAQKYPMIVHAEANAIVSAPLVLRGRGCALITTKYPCSSCAKLIIQSGIYQVHTPPSDATHEPWATDAVFTKTMLEESGVEVWYL